MRAFDGSIIAVCFDLPYVLTLPPQTAPTSHFDANDWLYDTRTLLGVSGSVPSFPGPAETIKCTVNNGANNAAGSWVPQSLASCASCSKAVRQQHIPTAPPCWA